MENDEISKFLKSNVLDARLTCNGKSLIWNNVDNVWYVYYRPRYAQQNKCLYSGESIQDALKILGE